LYGLALDVSAIMYNDVELHRKTVVKLEMVDSDNNWHKAYQFIDSGGWGDTGQVCGGNSDQIITWPLTIFR
jgi:hypothetical protein